VKRQKQQTVIDLISPIENTIQRMGVHGPLNLLEVGSSKHPLPTGRTRRAPHIKGENQCVQIRKTEQSAVKISTTSQVNGKIHSQNQYPVQVME
jgi:hypothetical protein